MPSAVVGIERLLLAELTLPDWHPRSADGTCDVFGYAIRHRDGVILFDTGVGTGNDFIDDMYQPRVIPVGDALAAHGIDERDVVAVVNSHLHFDHCGQNDVFHRHGVPIHVQDREIDAARAFAYTVPEWAAVPERALRAVRGDEFIAEGVQIIETIGHTPGHQSLVVDAAGGPAIVGGQCVYCTDELLEGHASPDNAHDESYLDAAQQSLDRIIGLRPHLVVVAHDPADWVEE